MKNFACQILTQPAAEPISVSEFKQWARVDDNSQDDVIANLITTAREFAEDYTGRAGVTATYRQTMDYLPLVYDDRIALNMPIVQPAIRNYWKPFLADLNVHMMRSPLIAVSSIQYYDGTGALQTMDPGQYVATTTHEPGRVCPSLGNNWPTTQDRPEAAQIVFTAGYATARTVPARYRQAICLLAAHHYEHRESVSEVKLEEVPQSVTALLDQLMVRWQW